MAAHDRKKRWVLPLAAAVTGFVLSRGAMSASAADLGGNCCADLEERIAELEATTARKGNRNVSLTVSGWVNEAIFFWDDGVEDNVYVGTNELEQSRFRFNGDAKINGSWGAGFMLEIGANSTGSKSFSQNTDGIGGMTLRKSAWFVKGKDLGKLTVGLFDTATYHLLDNVDTTLTRNVSDFEAAGVALGAFRTRSNGALNASTWLQFMGGFNNGASGQSGLRNNVRYDTPEFAGFVATASWGEDDQWEAALKYKGEFGDFKFNGAIGYGESTDNAANKGQCSAGNGDCQWWGVGALAQHVPTGVYVYGGYAHNQIDLLPGQVVDDEAETWYVQAGIEQKWNALGKTNIFGEYRKDDVGFSQAAASSNLDFWSAGVAQNIENADITLYALYRHAEGDFIAKAGGAGTLDDFDMVITGAKINF